MTLLPLKNKKTIGWNYSVNPEDVLKTKTTLNHMGHYEMPDFGLTPLS